MSVLSMYLVFRAQNFEPVDLSGYEQKNIHKEDQVLFLSRANQITEHGSRSG